MTSRELSLQGVWLIEGRRFEDDRGYFRELYRDDRAPFLAESERFVQDNLSVSRRGVVRGLHYQHPNGQAKLVACLEGEIFDVAVDIRRESATFGQWLGERLTADNCRELFIPTGFAHGFSVLSGRATVVYKCTALYAPDCDQGIRFDDPTLAIDWQVESPVVSQKDLALPKFQSYFGVEATL